MISGYNFILRWEQHHAAVNADDLPGHVVGKVGGEKFHHFGAVFRFAHAPQGDVRRGFRLVFRAVAVELFVGAAGQDQAGRDAVDIDVVGAEFARQKPRILRDARFGDAVVRDVRPPDCPASPPATRR